MLCLALQSQPLPELNKNGHHQSAASLIDLFQNEGRGALLSPLMARRLAGRTWQGLRLFLLAALVAGGGAGQSSAWAADAAAAKLPTLRQIGEVLRLGREGAVRHYPVEIEGVVSCAHPGFGLLFVQDKSGGIFLNPPRVAVELRSGMRVAVRAVSEEGLFSPILDQVQVEIIGPGELPEPQQIGLGQLTGGGADSQWVEVDAMVHEEEMVGEYLRLKIASGLDRCHVWVQKTAGYSGTKFLDAKVRLRGVVGGIFDNHQRLLGFQLYLCSLADITLLEGPPPDAFNNPVLLGSDLNKYSPMDGREHRVRVRGVVTMQQPDNVVFIRDASGGIRLDTKETTPLPIGTRVDAVGFRMPADLTAHLQSASLRKSGSGEVPTPVPIAPAQVFDEARRYDLVSTEATLLGQEVTGDRTYLFLRIGERIAAAPLATTNGVPPTVPAEPGSRVRVTGVLESQNAKHHPGTELCLWMRSPDDLVVLARPMHRWRAATIWPIGISSAVIAGLAGALCWALWRAQKRTEQSAREAERHLHRYIQEREHIGQDLHDNIIQSIYAVGLGLEDCRRSLSRSPEQATERLGTAIRALNEVIEDVRRFIGGLEPKVLSGRELKAALKSLALTVGESSTQFSIRVDAHAAQYLTSQQATHLLNIAKEAMSNSLRHAKASQTEVALRPGHGGVRLEIADDGVGFDSRNQATGGNGFRNMAARARELGGRLEITSTPGQGTRVILDLPGISLHEHRLTSP